MIHESLLKRKIIHFDMDAFYASVEVRDDPKLAGKALVIGGSPQSRGVVCTASYEARQFGIRSAMSCAQAYKRCPEAIFLRPNFSKYKVESEKIRAIFQDYTDTIEPLSLDEAYLDVTGQTATKTATHIAHEIQMRISKELGLTGSAGVAPNKMVAKISSDIRKPFGITVVTPAQVEDFMLTLKLRKIPGIGPATERSLAKLNLTTCFDVFQLAEHDLIGRLGERMGRWLYRRVRGIDEREVAVSRERKSMSVERTFSEDLISLAAIEQKLSELSVKLLTDINKKQIWGRTWSLKVKYNNFDSVTRSITKELDSTVGAEGILTLAVNLLKKTEAGSRPIRLLGIGVSNLEEKNKGQLRLIGA